MGTRNPHWHAAVGFGIVILMGLGTFALAAKTFTARLQAPFGLTPQSSLADASFAPDSPEAFLEQTKDTDRDGIPDAQELQVYKTSPFLEDSDSDGTRDKEEIEAGTDPNCPKGKDCRALALPLARDAEQQALAAKLYESTGSAKFEKSGIPGISDAASVRNFLRQAGVAEDILKQFDDETLVKMFRETAVRQEGAGVGSGLVPDRGGAQGPALQEQAGAIPANPSPQEIRELLLRSGIDQAILDKFNDEQVVKLYQETLKEVKQ